MKTISFFYRKKKRVETEKNNFFCFSSVCFILEVLKQHICSLVVWFLGKYTFIERLKKPQREPKRRSTEVVDQKLLSPPSSLSPVPRPSPIVPSRDYWKTIGSFSTCTVCPLLVSPPLFFKRKKRY